MLPLFLVDFPPGSIAVIILAISDKVNKGSYVTVITY